MTSPDGRTPHNRWVATSIHLMMSTESVNTPRAPLHTVTDSTTCSSTVQSTSHWNTILLNFPERLFRIMLLLSRAAPCFPLSLSHSLSLSTLYHYNYYLSLSSRCKWIFPPLPFSVLVVSLLISWNFLSKHFSSLRNIWVFVFEKVFEKPYRHSSWTRELTLIEIT